MRVPDLFTASERRMAMLLFTLSLIGIATRAGRGLSPEIDAWLQAGSAPAVGDSAQAMDRPLTAAPPSTSRQEPEAGIPEKPGAGPGPIDPNTAELDVLTTLPGIGPALARRILDDRAANGPYLRAADLLRVKGIGPATLARIRPRLSLP